MRRVGCVLAVAVLSACGSPTEPPEADLALTTAAADPSRRRGPVDEAGEEPCKKGRSAPGDETASCMGRGPNSDRPGAPGAPDSPAAPDSPDGGGETGEPDAYDPVDGAFLANEPNGMIEVFGNNAKFPRDRSGPNRANAAGGGHDSWGWHSSRWNFASADPRSEGIPNSPSSTDADNVWVGIFPQGHGPGTGPFSIAYSRPNQTSRRSMYWSMYLYFSDPFDYNTCTTKGFWTSQTGGNNHFLPIYRRGTAFGLYLQFNDKPRDTDSNRHYQGMPSRKLDERLGKWFHLEVLMVANTDGAENGKYRLWIDGSLEVAHDTVYYFDEADFRRGRDSFETIRLNPTWGCKTGGSVPQRQLMALDDWYASYSSSRVH